jgi:predicted DNA-binding transcriptional regulator AlpA
MTTETSSPPALAAKPKPQDGSLALLVAAPEAAQLCGVSEATWWRHHSAGRVPAPVKLGGRTLWRRQQLELWIELGCPDRATFEVEAKARNGNGRPRQPNR